MFGYALRFQRRPGPGKRPAFKAFVQHKISAWFPEQALDAVPASAAEQEQGPGFTGSHPVLSFDQLG